MERQIIVTEDGSNSIYFPQWDEQYHSKHGAIQESNHVFLDKGFHHFLQQYPKKRELSILEVGLGTGLNALMTVIHAKRYPTKINYVGVEGYPLSIEEASQLNYVKRLDATKEESKAFETMHTSEWGIPVELNKRFTLTKRKQLFEKIDDNRKYNLIYFDAFGARVQPELWTKEIFVKMHKALKKNGVLTTYAAKGSVRRIMEDLGFKVERLPGPPGKREMLRATRV